MQCYFYYTTQFWWMCTCSTKCNFITRCALWKLTFSLLFISTFVVIESPFSNFWLAIGYPCNQQIGVFNICRSCPQNAVTTLQCFTICEFRGWGVMPPIWWKDFDKKDHILPFLGAASPLLSFSGPTVWKKNWHEKLRSMQQHHHPTPSKLSRPAFVTMHSSSDLEDLHLIMANDMINSFCNSRIWSPNIHNSECLYLWQEKTFYILMKLHHTVNHPPIHLHTRYTVREVLSKTKRRVKYPEKNPKIYEKVTSFVNYV